jgi:hypothetical protein
MLRDILTDPNDMTYKFTLYFYALHANMLYYMCNVSPVFVYLLQYERRSDSLNTQEFSRGLYVVNSF